MSPPVYYKEHGYSTPTISYIGIPSAFCSHMRAARKPAIKPGPKNSFYEIVVNRSVPTGRIQIETKLQNFTGCLSQADGEADTTLLHVKTMSGRRRWQWRRPGVERGVDVWRGVSCVQLNVCVCACVCVYRRRADSLPPKTKNLVCASWLDARLFGAAGKHEAIPLKVATFQYYAPPKE